MNKQSSVGDWRIDWSAGWIRRRLYFWSKRNYPDSRVLAVLKLLVDRRGEVVPVEDILHEVWPDRVVSRDSISTAIYQLRQLLGDDSQRSMYIKTEARRGYRLIAPVSTPVVESRWAVAAGFSIALVGAAWFATEFSQQEPALIRVEQMNDQTADASSKPLYDAIGSTLIGELVNQLPGRVISDASPVPSAYTFQSQIVACDLGPALLVSLVDTDDSRFLWAQAYRLNDWTGGPDEPTLVQEVAREVGEFVRTL